MCLSNFAFATLSLQLDHLKFLLKYLYSARQAVHQLGNFLIAKLINVKSLQQLVQLRILLVVMLD